MISIQLIEFPGSRIIYDQRVEYREKEIFDLVDQVILQVTNLLQDKINQSLLSESYKKTDVELEAYELFLIGNAHLQHGTPEDDQSARSYFERAISKQPNFARAYSGISSSYFNEWSCQLWDRWEISQLGAKKYALKAIELDENDYIALSILGRVLLFEGDFDQAEYYLRRSLEMNRNDASSLLQIAFSFVFLGYTDEAIELYERSCQLNPMTEDKHYATAATLYFEHGDFQKALDIGKKLDTNQTFIDFPFYMAAAAHYLGKEQEARLYWDQFLERFQNHIYFGKKSGSKDALSWQISINPYKNTTQLAAFRDYMKENSSYQLSTQESYKSGNNLGVLNCTENLVQLDYANKGIDLKKTKGLTDIATLIGRPHQDIHCLELMGGHQQDTGSINVLDEKSKKEYQRRILDLQSEIREAEEMHDMIRAGKLSEEYEKLADHLSRSLGLSGKSRKAASAADKARAAVTLRIRDCIRKITEKHGPLGAHLSNSIKTGMLCSYRPENEIKWKIEGI
jgi:tetratricopeptide (TPR) repeat protein